MTLRQEFEKQINIESLSHEDELNHAMAWMYIQWLESKLSNLTEEKRKAFEAGREPVKIETPIGVHHYMEYKYKSFEDYNKEKP